MRLITVLIVIIGCSSLSQAQQNPHANLALFEHSDNCIACHSNLTSASGQDVSIGYLWRASMMANSARDPYWHAAVRRETMDHPQAREAIEDKCSTCHMPMHRFETRLSGQPGRVFETLANQAGAAPGSSVHLGMDGVSCTVCHQIQADNFGQPSSFTGGFMIDTTTPAEQRKVYGPYDIDRGRQAVMQSSARFTPTQSTHIQQSELCATCHTLYTHSLDDQGNEVGELAEQVPYLEWLFSDFRETNSCQSCHMPVLAEAAPISSVVGDPRDEFSQHVFRGGNAFMLGILARYRDELNVTATAEELRRTRDKTLEYLSTSSSRLTIADVRQEESGTLAFGVFVENLAGHKLPTAYPSRRVWLHVKVLDAGGMVLFESGAVNADGSIQGNTNDRDPGTYEPHYDLITSPDQVQIYEPILADYRGEVTTGLLYAVTYLKDNRLLPRGFDKTSAQEDIAVAGAALDDSDFVGGSDHVRFRLNGIPSAASIDVRLMYQSIGYRWAANLKEYDAPETNRFVGYYQSESHRSAVQLSSAQAQISR